MHNHYLNYGAGSLQRHGKSCYIYIHNICNTTELTASLLSLQSDIQIKNQRTLYSSAYISEIKALPPSLLYIPTCNTV